MTGFVTACKVDPGSIRGLVRSAFFRIQQGHIGPLARGCVSPAMHVDIKISGQHHRHSGVVRPSL
jgi:hypothetical protein